MINSEYIMFLCIVKLSVLTGNCIIFYTLPLHKNSSLVFVYMHMHYIHK